MFSVATDRQASNEAHTTSATVSLVPRRTATIPELGVSAAWCLALYATCASRDGWLPVSRDAMRARCAVVYEDDTLTIGIVRRDDVHALWYEDLGDVVVWVTGRMKDEQSFGAIGFVDDERATFVDFVSLRASDAAVDGDPECAGQAPRFGARVAHSPSPVFEPATEDDLAQALGARPADNLPSIDRLSPLQALVCLEETASASDGDYHSARAMRCACAIVFETDRMLIGVDPGGLVTVGVRDFYGRRFTSRCIGVVQRGRFTSWREALRRPPNRYGQFAAE